MRTLRCELQASRRHASAGRCDGVQRKDACAHSQTHRFAYALAASSNLKTEPRDAAFLERMRTQFKRWTGSVRTGHIPRVDTVSHVQVQACTGVNFDQFLHAFSRERQEAELRAEDEKNMLQNAGNTLAPLPNSGAYSLAGVVYGGMRVEGAKEPARVPRHAAQIKIATRTICIGRRLHCTSTLAADGEKCEGKRPHPLAAGNEHGARHRAQIDGAATSASPSCTISTYSPSAGARTGNVRANLITHHFNNAKSTQTKSPTSFHHAARKLQEVRRMTGRAVAQVLTLGGVGGGG